MYKAVPNLKGCMLGAISPIANVLIPDATLYAIVSAVLGVDGTDHTYARLGYPPQCEYVRIEKAVNGFFIIGRGVDNTAPLPFGAMTEVEYVVALEGVQMLIAESVPPIDLVLTANAPLEVQQLGTNQFNISIPVPVFSSTSNTVDVTGDYPIYDVNVVRGANGCCN